MKAYLFVVHDGAAGLSERVSTHYQVPIAIWHVTQDGGVCSCLKSRRGFEVISRVQSISHGHVLGRSDRDFHFEITTISVSANTKGMHAH